MDLTEYIMAAILYDIRANDRTAFLTARKLADVEKSLEKAFRGSPGIMRTEAAVNSLIEHGVITVITDPLTSDYFNWNKIKANQLFDRQIADPSSIFFKAANLGSQWITEAISNIGRMEDGDNLPPPRLSVPASDRIVSINDNSPEWAYVRDGLENIDELVRSDNSNKIPDPNERSRFGAQIKAARQLLSVKNVSLGAIGVILMPVLRHLIAIFGDEAIGQMAKNLVDAITKALGLA